jgi:tetratricopeptide (TPR) repeat protein
MAITSYTAALNVLQDDGADVVARSVLHSNLSAAFERQQQHVEALEHAKRALELRPDWEKVCNQ